jgi:hypothetical protein
MRCLNRTSLSTINSPLFASVEAAYTHVGILTLASPNMPGTQPGSKVLAFDTGEASKMPLLCSGK